MVIPTDDVTLQRFAIELWTEPGLDVFLAPDYTLRGSTLIVLERKLAALAREDAFPLERAS